jgi:membrane-bound metal-dependent hydrolase YbcI (DUF457 family)
MPTPLAHSFCGLLFYPETEKHLFKNKVYTGCFIVFLSFLPDLDYLAGMFSPDLKNGHRLVTHSFLFSLTVAIACGISAKLMKKKILPFFIITASILGLHIFLDYLSFDTYPQNGVGIALLWPFTRMFFNFPFHPLAGWIGNGSEGLFFVFLSDLCFMAFCAGLFFIVRYSGKEKRCVSGS